MSKSPGITIKRMKIIQEAFHLELGPEEGAASLLIKQCLNRPTPCVGYDNE